MREPRVLMSAFVAGVIVSLGVGAVWGWVVGYTDGYETAFARAQLDTVRGASTHWARENMAPATDAPPSAEGFHMEVAK